MASTLPFISQSLKTGDPPLSWTDFKKPKLRKFAGPTDFQLQEYLGGGEDGSVFKAFIQHQPVAVKIFVHNRQPEPIRGLEFYWAFERECMNCALLEMIEASLKRAEEGQRPVRLCLRPTTKKQALRNLWAFSDEGWMPDQETPAAQTEAFAPEVTVNGCLGWMELKGSTVNAAFERCQVTRDVKDDETYWAIVYEFVPADKLDGDTVLSQLDFFHVTGFYSVPLNPANWRGSGVLVDFSDIVSPFAHVLDWDAHSYARNQKTYHGAVRSLARKGFL